MRVSEQAPPAAGFTIRSSDAPPGETVSWWLAATNTLVKLTHDRIEEPLEAEARIKRLDETVVAEMRCGRMDVRRTPRDVAVGPLDACYVFQQLDPRGSRFDTPRHADLQLAAGDMVLGDADAAFASSLPSGSVRFGHRVWLIPRSFLAEEAPRLEPGVPIDARNDVGRLLAAYLRELWQLDGVSPAQSRGAVEVAARLMALAAGARDDEPHRIALAEGQLAFIKRRILTRLADPLLSPSRIAADCGVSLRKLHALFEPTEETFASHVTALRLKAARRRLLDPARRAQPVTEIAFALGFNSLSTFYRNYREAFGEAPGDTRAGALEQP